MNLPRAEHELWLLLRADPVARSLGRRVARWALALGAAVTGLAALIAAIAYGGLP